MKLRSDLLPRLAGPVLLRRLRPSDVTAFLAYRSDPVVARYQGWAPMSDTQASEFIAEMANAPLFQPGAWIQLAIARTRDDALVGDVGLFVAEDFAFAEVGFTVAPTAQARGYASAAAAAALELLLEHTVVTRVIGVTDARNTASVKVLERAGMARVESREAMFKGEPCIEWVYARSRDD